jgi:hypothetical protein
VRRHPLWQPGKHPDVRRGRGMTNIPGLSLTEKHFDIYRARDNDPLFIEYLFEEEYVTTPGQY